MKEQTLDVLAACGRERVFHNSGAPPSVAIRWAFPTPGEDPPEEKWIREEGATHDEAGEKVAASFARRLVEKADALERRAEGLRGWAKRIELALRKDRAP